MEQGSHYVSRSRVDDTEESVLAADDEERIVVAGHDIDEFRDNGFVLEDPSRDQIPSFPFPICAEARQSLPRRDPEEAPEAAAGLQGQPQPLPILAVPDLDPT